MDKRILWVDLETTGLDPVKNGIIQIAAAVEINGTIVDTFNQFQNPSGKEICDEALKVNGQTLESLSAFQCPVDCYTKFNAFLDTYGFRGDKSRRYIPAGYNIRFDLDFLTQYFLEMSGGPYSFWEHLQYKPIDPFAIVIWLWRENILDIPDCKLSTIAKYLNIQINVHDAMSDILATIQVSKTLKQRFINA